MTLQFAEYQVRLLLCRPADRTNNHLHWNCGCSAAPCAYKKYRVEPCDDHAWLFSLVREDEEPPYNSFTAPVLRTPSGQRL